MSDCGTVQCMAGDRPFLLADGLDELARLVVHVHETACDASLVWSDRELPLVMVEYSIAGVRVSFERFAPRGFAVVWEFTVSTAEIEAWRGR